MTNTKSARTFAYEATLEPVDIEQRTVISRITTDDVNRYDSVVLTKGIYRANYEKNPIVLLNHHLDKPVGTNDWIKDKLVELIAQTRFAKTVLGDETLMLYKDDILRAFSIKISYYLQDTEEKDNIFYINKSEMEEYSCVTVPANVNSLRLIYDGLKSPELKADFKLMIDEDTFKEEYKSLKANYDELRLKYDDMNSLIVNVKEDMNKIKSEFLLINQEKIKASKIKNIEKQILQRLLN